MFGLPYENPLTQYHNYLRLGAQSGYPNQTYASPHPYEMQAWHQQPAVNRYPFRYGMGRSLRLQIRAPSPGGFGLIHGPSRSLYRPYGSRPQQVVPQQGLRQPNPYRFGTIVRR